MDKINLIYYNTNQGKAPYFIRAGLKKALEDVDALNYSCNLFDTKFDDEKLKEYPVLSIRGYMDYFYALLSYKNLKKLFKATLHTESLKNDRISAMALDKQKEFDLYFIFSECDLNKFEIKTKHILSWVDLNYFDNKKEPVIKNKIGFVGNMKGRRLDFCNNIRDILHITECHDTKNIIEDTKEYVLGINKCRFNIVPISAEFDGMTGRVFEALACKRLCFCYMNEDTMFIAKKSFEDGEDIVYFRNEKELREKFMYYLENPSEANEIMQKGYDKVRKYHSQDVRVKQIVNSMYSYNRYAGSVI